MLPFKLLLVGLVLSAAQGQHSRSSRASRLQKPDEQLRSSRSSNYYDDQYGYNMPKSIVLKDDPNFESRFSFPRFPRLHLPLEPSHHEYRYKRSDVEAKVRTARSFFVSDGSSVFTKRSAVDGTTLQKRTFEQTRPKRGAVATPIISSPATQRVARAAPTPTLSKLRPAVDTVAKTSQRVARNAIQKRSDETKFAGSAHVPTYVPNKRIRNPDFYAVPDAEYDGAPGYEAYQRSDYEAPEYEEQPYEEPTYRKPAYKKSEYKEPTYKEEPAYKKTSYKEPAYPAYETPKPAYKAPKPTYGAPAYPKPSYSEPAYPKPSYNEPAYPKPSYSEPAYPKPSYNEPAYPKPSYNEPAYPKPSYNEPAYPKPSYNEPVYPKPAYSEPAYSKPSYSEPAYPKPAYDEPKYPKPIYNEPAYKEPSYPSYPEPSYDPKPEYESNKPNYPSYEPPTYDDEVTYGAQTGYNGAFNWYADYPVKTPAKTAYY